MNAIFPGKKRFIRKDETGKVVAEWHKPELDWTAKVVCEQCNNGWMSDLENQHAQPAMTDLIVGNKDFVLSRARARSVALFAFKTAVVCDHMRRDEQPFFPRSSRHRFAKCLAIPWGMSMWMAGFLPMGKGEVNTAYYQGELSSANRLRMYVCTYAVGHLVFQVVAARQQAFVNFWPREGFEHLAFPFWPTLPIGLSWPPPHVLRTTTDFDGFANRWEIISRNR